MTKEEIIKLCAEICMQEALDAAHTANSKYVTLAGKQLHEGMYGGAMNCHIKILNLLKESNEVGTR